VKPAACERGKKIHALMVSCGGASVKPPKSTLQCIHLRPRTEIWQREWWTFSWTTKDSKDRCFASHVVEIFGSSTTN
jgi:hypothetical protein